MEKLIFVAKINTMKRLFLFFCFILFITGCYAQKYLRPVFDRTDSPTFHLDSVEFTKDSTFLFFTYEAEAGSWANISDKAFIRDVKTGKKFLIQSVSGIPFQPSKRHFLHGMKVPVKLSSVSTGKLNCFDFIVNDSAYNIYGIDISSQFAKPYSIGDEQRFTKLSDFYSKVNDSIALQYRLQELEARKYLYGNKSEEASLSIYQIAFLYNKLGNHSKAVEYGLQALDCQAILYGKDNKEVPVYPMTLSTIAGFYSDMGDLKKSIQFYRESALLYRKIMGINDRNYAEVQYLLASTYMKADSITKAISIMQEVVELQKINLGERHHNTIMSINNLAGYLEYDGKFIEAIEIRKNLTKLLKDDSELIDMYAQNLHNLAGSYANLHDYDKAISYAWESLELRKKLFGENSIEYANSLSNLAGYYTDSYMKDSLAIALCQQSLDIKKRILGNEDINITTTLSILASLYENRGDLSKAILTAEEALQIIEKCKGVEYAEYANLLSNISSYYQESEKFQEAIKYCKQAVEVYKKIYGDKHNIYSENLAYLAGTYAAAGDFHSATQYMNEALSIFKVNCSKSLDEIDDRWKSLFWNKYSDFFNWTFPYYVSNDMSIENIALLYNHLLFSKGLLISSQVSSNTDVTWQTIQASLKEDEIAIELVTSGSYSAKGDSLIIGLYALTLKKCHVPQMYKLVELKTAKQGLSETEIDKLYDGFGDKIWGKLSSELVGVKKIFFSSTSFCDFIPIEYLKTSECRNISEQYNIYRLSSTKEIIKKSENNIGRSALLYGGLDYYDLKNIKKTGNKERGGYDYLPHSLEEVKEIADILKASKCDVKVLTGNEGTEDSFRAMSGKPLGIIHLATHSGNISHKDEQDNLSSGNLSFIQIENNKVPIYEDKALSRSFIVLSGGNQLVQRKNVTDDCDGILTAKEIAELDFHATDLIVLSSCESGLGDRGLDDAIIGLQRGFKKAGANTILMSLHKVDDEATKILMVEFYRNLMSGKSKLQSLKDAQQYLRIVENGKYDAPKYWASFIMLDGLN